MIIVYFGSLEWEKVCSSKITSSKTKKLIENVTHNHFVENSIKLIRTSKVPFDQNVESPKKKLNYGRSYLFKRIGNDTLSKV